MTKTSLSNPDDDGRKANGRIERAAHLRWVPISKMRKSAEQAKRFNPARVDYLASNLDLEQIGAPVVSSRAGYFWIIDGQHRIAALESIGWGDQQVQCWTYEGLTEADEAERFLVQNDTLAVSPMTKFKVGVAAGREVECDINRIVLAQDYNVSTGVGGIGAVSALRRVYSNGGPTVLRQTLGIINDAYGEAGMSAAVLVGIGMVVQRYGDELDHERLVDKLSNTKGGMNGLLSAAEMIRKQLGNQKPVCVAAAAVDIYNSGRGGKKIAGWHRYEATA
ncbi:MAG: hypothetical protein NVSMB4_06990 [Acidimicrobiales bacterium]